MRLLGHVEPSIERPYVVLKYAQTLDGRIATTNGDSQWISGEAERQISDAMRAARDAVVVGIGTILRDDPQLTVRMVPGASPLRVVLDSALRVPMKAKDLSADAATLVITSDRSDPAKRENLKAVGVGVHVVPTTARGLDIPAVLAQLRDAGVESVLIEGGAKVVTSVLAAALVDRIVVGTAPKIMGNGTNAIGDLGVGRVTEAIRLINRTVQVTDDDVLMAWDVDNSHFRSKAADDRQLVGAGEER